MGLGGVFLVGAGNGVGLTWLTYYDNILGMNAKETAESRRLRRRLKALGPVMKGSLAEVELTCGTPGCRCHAGGPKHKGHYFSYRVGGKSHTVYVPKSVAEDAKHAHARWRSIRLLLEELTAQTVEVLRQRAAKRRRRDKEQRP